MKKIILLLAMIPLNGYAKGLSLYIDGVPIASNAFYLLTETLTPGYGSGKSTSWGLDATYNFNSYSAISCAYYSDGVGIMDFVTKNPTYTLSYKRFLSDPTNNARYFVRLGVLYSPGMLGGFSDSSGKDFGDHMPILTIGRERFFSNGMSVSGEIGPGYFSFLIGYNF